MIRSVIIDDEPEAVRGFISLLGIFCPAVEVTGHAGTVKEAVQLIVQRRPELVFLDIELNDGLGFQVLEQVPRRNFHTVFVTAFDHYAIRALRMNAMDYLMKPVEPDELAEAIQRVELAGNYPDYTNLLGGYRSGSYRKIGLPCSKGTIYVDLDEIERLESSNNYTYIYTTKGKRFLVSKTIKSFEYLLPANNFVRCHQRHIVNLEYVKAHEKTNGGGLVMLNQAEIPVSRSNRVRVEYLLSQKYPRI